jgi:energy-coupling factor transport system permease protein
VSSLVPTYRRTGSPLHAARSEVGAAYVAALSLLALVYDHPLVLLAALAAIIAAGLAAGVGPELARAARLALPLALLVALVNPLVSQEGLTVLVQGWSVPVLGRLDITLEAVAYGALTGLRVVVLILAFGLFSAAVDPDEILRLAGRLSLRSSLTASLATRLVPVLGRDAERLADAYLLRAERPTPSRHFPRLRRAAILTRALAAGSLERAVELAAALEVRGYAATPWRRPRARTPWSGHDIAFAASAAALVLVALAGAIGGVAPFDAYPTLHVGWSPLLACFAIAIVALALVPFAAAALWRTHLARVDAAVSPASPLRDGGTRD